MISIRPRARRLFALVLSGSLSVGFEGHVIEAHGWTATQRGRPPAGPKSSPPQPPPPATAPEPPDLRGEDGLTRAYDVILDGRFDELDAELQRACGPAPPEACAVLEATGIWWRILLDPHDRSLDEQFSASVERAIHVTEEWTRRAPGEAEAWFYLGGAFAARVQWRVLRDNKLAAARDGKRIKQAMEQAIELAPGLDDAYFGIGLYKYYADVAPAAAKFLRFFLLLPGGDREEGLEQMERARDRGRLLQGEADYQLHLIYLWYERQPLRALELLEGLQRQYPGNPLFTIHIAEIEDVYQHDVTRSLDIWRALLARARQQRVNAAGLAEVQARLGIARQLEALHQTDDAIEQLEQIVKQKPAAPYGSRSLAWLRLGEAHDRLGARAAARDAYRHARSAAPADDPHDVRRLAEAKSERAPDPRRAEAYRLSLEGWRALERSDLDAATVALERSLSLNADEPVAHYRYGRVLQAQKQEAAALRQYELAIRGARTCPPSILATTYLEAARLHERGGQRDQALAWYRVAATHFGAAAETRNAATRALARLQK